MSHVSCLFAVPSDLKRFKYTPTQLGLTVSVLAETKRDASRTEVDTKREKKKIELLCALTT